MTVNDLKGDREWSSTVQFLIVVHLCLFLLPGQFAAQLVQFIPCLYMECLPMAARAADLYALQGYPVQGPAPDRTIDQPAYECFHLVGVSTSG